MAELLRPRILIGADGPRSRVGAAIGRVNRRLVDTRQVTVPLVLPHDATDIFLSRRLPRRLRLAVSRRARSPTSALASRSSLRHRLKPMLAALFEPARRFASNRSQGYGLTGGAIPVGGRCCARSAAWAKRCAARGRCGRAHQSGHRRRHRVGGAVGRARRPRRGGPAWRGERARFDEYEEELGDIFDAALDRALRRRRRSARAL